MLGALHRLKLRKHPSNHPNVHRCKLMSTGSPKGVVLAQLEKLFPGIRMPSARPRFSVIESERESEWGRGRGKQEMGKPHRQADQDQVLSSWPGHLAHSRQVKT